MVALLPGRTVQRTVAPALGRACWRAAVGLVIWNWHAGHRTIMEGALAVDPLALGLSLLFYAAGIAAILLSLARARDARGRPRRVLGAAARLDHRAWPCWSAPRT